MPPNILNYLIQQITSDVFGFFFNWYVRFPRAWRRQVARALKDWDRSFALEFMVKNFFKPLYQDYTIVGYMVAVAFRIVRIISAFVFYAFYLLAAVIILFTWLAIPIFIGWAIFANLVLGPFV